MSFAKCALSGWLRSKLFFVLALVGGCIGAAFWALSVPLPTADHPLRFYSSHLRDDLKLVFLSALKKAHSSLAIYMYGLSDVDILNQLAHKQQGGVQITLFHDRKGTPPLPPGMRGYPVECSGLMHRKVVVVDDAITFIGTANCTTASLKIHDNLLVGIYHPPLAHFFAQSTSSRGVFSVGSMNIEVFLLPDSGGEALSALVDALQKAEQTITLAMFTLTHPRLVEALMGAKQRGVDIEVYTDAYGRKGASKKAIDQLEKAGIALRTSKGGQLVHHKWVVIDQETFIFGSANWTQAAFQKNQDFLCICTGFAKPEIKKLFKLVKHLKSDSKFIEKSV